MDLKENNGGLLANSRFIYFLFWHSCGITWHSGSHLVTIRAQVWGWRQHTKKMLSRKTEALSTDDITSLLNGYSLEPHTQAGWDDKYTFLSQFYFVYSFNWSKMFLVLFLKFTGDVLSLHLPPTCYSLVCCCKIRLMA